MSTAGKAGNMDQTNLAKDFFHAMYHPVMDDKGRLSDGQHLRLYQRSRDGDQRVTFFQDPDTMLEYCWNTRSRADCYFTLATTNGKGGATDDLIERTVLGFDFDGLSMGDIIIRFNRAHLFYHAVVSSGHGFHVYLAIEPTRDHKRVERLQKAMAAVLGADPNAANTTQLLRVPGTLNHKGDRVGVHVVQLYPLESIRRYSLDRLERRFVLCDQRNDTPARAMLATSNVPPCIEKILRDGSVEGVRNSHLLNVVVMLRKRGKTLPQILSLCRSWAEKSDFRDALEYRVRYIYENQQQPVMDCSHCEHRTACRVTIDSDFDYSDDLIVLRVDESQVRKMLAVGDRAMRANSLFVFGVLKLHTDGLTMPDLLEQIAYDGKPVLGEKAVRAALRELIDNKIVTVEEWGREHKRYYRVNDVSSLPEWSFDISFAATVEVTKGRITPAELRLYYLMRYLHHKQHREGTSQLAGNLFQIDQRELADRLGVSQGRVAQMIKNLLREKMIAIYARQPSKNNGWDFNIYRLAY